MASKGSIAARANTARDRLRSAMGRLSEQAGVPLPADVFPVKQPELRAVAELERVADFLDTLSKPVSAEPARPETSPETVSTTEPPRRGPGRPRKSAE